MEIKTGKVFNDTANHWAKDYIATANAFGIANGYNNDIFGPNDAISREQMAVMIVKAAGLQSSGATLSFSDSAKVSDWAKDAVAIASAQKVITGFPDGSFQPQVEATRAQADELAYIACNWCVFVCCCSNNISFTVNPVPVTPAAPSVTNDDTANTVTGMTTAMEYKLDAAGYVVYDATAFGLLDFSGAHTLLIW